MTYTIDTTSLNKLELELLNKNYTLTELALIEYFEIDTIEDAEELIDTVDTDAEYVDYDGQEVRVFTGDDELAAAFKEACISYVDECLEVPDHIKKYFNYDTFTEDCRISDGEGHLLGSYDGNMHEFSYKMTRGDSVKYETIYICRVN